MEEKKYANIEEFDKANEPVTTEPVTEKEPDVAQESAPDKADKPADTKQDHAFKQLREEANKWKKTSEDYGTKLNKLEQISKNAGFESVDEMMEAWENQMIEDSAKEQKVDPVIAKELVATRKQLAEVTQQMTQKERQTRIVEINKEVQRLTNEFGISEEQMKNIVDQMGQDGITIEHLLAMPIKTLGRTISGYAEDIVLDKKVQAKLAKDKKGFSEDKVKSAKPAVTSDDQFSEEALKKEMEEWDRREHPWKYTKKK